MTDTSLKPESQPAEIVGSVPGSDNGSEIAELGDRSAGVASEAAANRPRASQMSLLGEIAKYSISILILGLGVFVFVTLSGFKKPPMEQVSKELIPMVETVPAVHYSGLLDKTISGTVVPFREINVAAEVSGNVISKADVFEAGHYVKKGTKLLEIDPADYQLELKMGLAGIDETKKMVDETRAEIAGAKKNVANAEKEVRLAENDHQRNLRIRNALSPAEVDQSKRTLLAAQTKLTSQKNNLDMMSAKLIRMGSTLELAKSQLDRSKLMLNRTVILAPDDGVIVKEMVQEGDYVRAGDSLVTFEDTSHSEVLCNLTPSDLAWIRNNSPANKEFEAEENSQNFSPYYLPKTNVSIYETSDKSVVWNGILERFDGIGRDESTRTIPVRITIKNPIVDTDQGQRALVRGMFVKCKIEVQTSADNAEHEFLSFPAVALRAGNYVWVVDDHKLRRVDVSVVDFGEQLIDDKVTKIVVVALKKDSLQSGDAIVATPIPSPQDGKEVILKSEQDESISAHNP